MPIDKDCISLPLEAGHSLLDVKQLPPKVVNALDYVSSRLAGKRLHLSLIIVRKDAHVPSLSSGSPKQAESHSPITASSARALFSSQTFKRSLSKSSSSSSISSTGGTSTVSVSVSVSSTTSNLPTSPTSSQPSTPTSPVAVSPNPYGITLMHASTMTVKAEKILRHVVAKAEKKFSIGSSWLPSQSLSAAHACPSTNDIIRRSLNQNEVLFSSEGLTLLSLDRVYTFKCQLHTYSGTLSQSDLAAAVDELRRLVLAQQGRRITKGYLMRAYDWLGISLAALVDVNEGYKVAYGGEQRFGGIDVQNEEKRSPPPLKTNFSAKEVEQISMGIEMGAEYRSEGSSINCSSDEGAGAEADDSDDSDESGKGKDEDMKDKLKEDRGPHLRGPVTPNRLSDITPVTKGEWCFLMVGEGWNHAKTAAVETC